MKVSILPSVVIFISIFLKIVQTTTSSYFYTEMVTLFDGNTVPKNYVSSGYNLPIVWQIAQPIIVNSSYHLMGWKISTGNKWLSYDASLNAVTSTGANLFFNPSTFSEILYINFGLILLTSQSGLVRLIYYEHNNCGLGTTSGRSEIVNVPIGTVFRSDIPSYKVQSLLSSFTVTYAGSSVITLNINVKCMPLISGSDFQPFEVWSQTQTVQKMAFTYCMIDIASFPFPPFAYFSVHVSWTALAAYITEPTLYAARQSYNCIVGMQGIDTANLASPHQLTMTQSTNADLTLHYEYINAGINGFKIGVACTKKNPYCQFDCQICSDNITCLKCFWGWSVTGGCTNITHCIEVDPNSTILNKCIKCSALKILAFGLCIDTYGCTSANYVWNVTDFDSFCVLCDTASGFITNPIDRMCVCMPNSTFDKTTNNRCIPCPSNCILCNEVWGMAECTQCAHGFIFNYPLNTTCYILPPHCRSINIISGQSSCTVCQDKYFININPLSIYLQGCSPCLIDCLTCNSEDKCLTCHNGSFPVIGGCTNQPHCMQVKKNDLALQKCNRCSSNYILISGLCTNIVGCTSAYLLRNRTMCLFCNAQLNFQLVSTSKTCRCKHGFYLNPSSMSCQSICGDGLVLNSDVCDDGNNEDNDGCSSLCAVQTDFACVNNGINSSRCVYLRYNVKLKVKSITKKFMKNKATFTFTISPLLSLYKHLNQSSFLLKSNRSMSNIQFQFQSNQIVVEMQFTQDLQTFSASLQILLPQRYFLQRKTQISFSMISNNTKLIMIKQRQRMILFSQIEQYFSIIVLCLFLLGSITHKMIGLQTLLPLQIIYLTHLLNNKRTPSYEIFGFFSKTAMNFIYQQNHQSNIRNYNPFVFSSQNQIVTVIIFLIISLFICILLIIIGIAMLTNKQTKDQKLSRKKAQLKHKIIAIVYKDCKNVVFSLSVGIFCVFWSLFISHITINKEQYSILVQMISFDVILFAFISFSEWKYFFVKKQKQNGKSIQNFDQKYIPLTLTFLISISFILCSGFIQLVQAEGFLTSVIVIYEIIILIFRPYKESFHNFAILYNNSIILCFMVWNLTRISNKNLQEEQNELLAIISFIFLIGVYLIISIVRIILQVKQIFKNCMKKQGQSQNIESSKSQEKMNENLKDLLIVKDNRSQLLPFRKQYLLKQGFDIEAEDFTYFPNTYFKQQNNIMNTSNRFLQNVLKSSIT